MTVTEEKKTRSEDAKMDASNSQNGLSLNRNVVDNAKYIIKKFAMDNREVTYQTLNRLLYLYEAIYMIVTSNDRLFDSEFYAYNFEIFNEKFIEEFKNYGSLSIEAKYDDIVIPNANLIFVDALYSLFNDWSTTQLISLTTSDTSPWGKIKKEYSEIIPKDIVIDKNDTRIWFNGLVDVDAEENKN